MIIKRIVLTSVNTISGHVTQITLLMLSNSYIPLCARYVYFYTHVQHVDKKVAKLNRNGINGNDVK